MSPRQPLIYLLYQPRMINDYGAFGGMRISREIQSTRRKRALVPLCPPKITHDLGSNPGRRCGKPTTNRLSYGTADSSVSNDTFFNCVGYITSNGTMSAIDELERI
jgi:hypothetical protein